MTAAEPAPPRRILGNLTGEADLERAFGTVPPGRRRRPSRAAIATASAAATLLRAFARDGDRLWTPAPVDPERLAPVPGLPIPVLESGPLSRLPPAAVLAWCETPEAAAERARSGAADLDPPEPDAPLADLLWRLPTAPPAVVAAIHHRAFHLALVRELGCALPGARMVASLAELEAHLAAGAANAVGGAAGGAWVVKAPLSAAGRSRHVAATAAEVADPAVRPRLAALFARHGPLLFEPWLARLDDWGAAAVVTASGVRLLGLHRLLVDDRGRFHGIELAASDEAPPGLPELDRARLEATAEAVGRALALEGYSGPFGIDAYRIRDPGGEPRLQPLGEINARLTFGFVARALAERLAPSPGETVRLAFGRTPPDGAVPLLRPGADGTAGAWLELRRA